MDRHAVAVLHLKGDDARTFSQSAAVQLGGYSRNRGIAGAGDRVIVAVNGRRRNRHGVGLGIARVHGHGFCHGEVVAALAVNGIDHGPATENLGGIFVLELPLQTMVQNTDLQLQRFRDAGGGVVRQVELVDVSCDTGVISLRPGAHLVVDQVERMRAVIQQRRDVEDRVAVFIIAHRLADLQALGPNTHLLALLDDLGIQISLHPIIVAVQLRLLAVIGDGVGDGAFNGGEGTVGILHHIIDRDSRIEQIVQPVEQCAVSRMCNAVDIMGDLLRQSVKRIPIVPAVLHVHIIDVRVCRIHQLIGKAEAAQGSILIQRDLVIVTGRSAMRMGRMAIHTVDERAGLVVWINVIRKFVVRVPIKEALRLPQRKRHRIL